MENNFKNINIGSLIKKKVSECNIDITRICNFFHCQELEINTMYKEKDINTGDLIKWSKLLEYDFFRLYSQHLILYSPSGKKGNNTKNSNSKGLPVFRKNIYTSELIDFVLEQINMGAMSKLQVIEEYGIPKTTLYKWLSKYNKQTEEEI